MHILREIQRQKLQNSFCKSEILQLLFLGHCSLQNGMSPNQLLCIMKF